MSQERVYTVEGMSCRHCVEAVHEEVAAIDGVDAVDLDLATGRLVVTGADVSDEAVRAAVADAGYAVAA